MFKDKVLIITGGTGSFGNAVLKRFLDTDITVAGMQALLRKLRFMQAIVRGEQIDAEE